MKTIGGMRNEMDFYSHCNEFEYIHDLVVVVTIVVVFIIRMNFTQLILQKTPANLNLERIFHPI